MYLFFDVETSGLPKDYEDSPFNVRNWPRIVQIAWLLFDSSENQIKSCNYIIKPKGFVIPDSAIYIHGITNEIANEKGVSILKVLNEFQKDLMCAKYVISHNASFDVPILQAEYFRKRKDDIFDTCGEISIHCTMLSSTKFVGIEHDYFGLKWPKLSELYFKLFHKKLEKSHDAFADVTATAECFWELKRLKVMEL